MNRLLAEEIIQNSNSDWFNPIVMIKKSDGKYRMYLDFRTVNSIANNIFIPCTLNLCQSI